MSEKVNDLVSEIKNGLSQTSSSQKDETRVMRAMLNDTSYEVGVYDRTGMTGTYNPAKDFRGMCASIISGAAKVPAAEAEQLMDGYEVKKSEAATMVNVSKEFVNTFVHCGRKLPIGGREKSNVSLSLKEVAASTRSYPTKIGMNEDGTPKYAVGAANVGAHESLRVHAPCPPWVK